MIDVNTVVSAAIKPKSAPFRAIVLARRHDVVCMSDEIEAELRSVLGRPKFSRAVSPDRRERIIAAVLLRAVRVTPMFRISDCRDEKDNMYLEAAWVAGASHVITGDRDLLDLDPWRGIRVVRPAEYVAAIRRRRGAARE